MKAEFFKLFLLNKQILKSILWTVVIKDLTKKYGNIIRHTLYKHFVCIVEL